MDQGQLFMPTPAGMIPAIQGDESEQTLDQRFEAFLLDSPDVYAEFCTIALDLKATGIEHYSADAVCHVIRFFRATRTKHDAFKINNSFVSRLARKAMQDHPELVGFFETRELKTKGKDSHGNLPQS